MTQPRFDVIAIGNAIVDIIAPCEDTTIADLGLARGVRSRSERRWN